jgi:tRNA(Ile)-lysidine synthase
VLQYINENLKSLGVKSNDRLLVAVSGGPDSIFLLHLLSQLAKNYPFTLHVGHLNHTLRGRESDEDELFVQRYAESLKIPSTSVRKVIPNEAKMMKRSKQDAARIVRYRVLEEIASKTQSQWIVTGHQADDQAETFLMRLIRGSGSRGLASIPNKRGKIIRPILHLTRDEILTYLERNRISFRSDSSNNLPIYFRNQIRHELLPILKKYNPNILKVLGNEVEIFTEEKRLFEERVIREAAKIVKMIDSNKSVLRISPFLKQPLSLQRGLLRSLFFKLKGDLNNFHFCHIEKLILLAHKGMTGHSINLPGRIQAYKLYGQLEFYNREIPETLDKFAFCLPVPGEVYAPELKMNFQVSIKRGPFPGQPKKNEIWFDLDKITLPLTIRSREQGDRIFSERLKGRQKKLQDIFVDLKISRLVRDHIPVLSGKDRILWIVGVERDFKSLVSPETKAVLSIEVDSLG